MEKKDEYNPSIELHTDGEHKCSQEATALMKILDMGREEIEAGEYQLASEFFDELRRERQANP